MADCGRGPERGSEVSLRPRWLTRLRYFPPRVGERVRPWESNEGVLQGSEVSALGIDLDTYSKIVKRS